MFKFIFHHDHDFLHSGMIGFRSESVDLPSDLLRNESELLALAAFRIFFLAAKSLQKIIKMGGKPELLFRDVEFLYIKYHLLFKASGIVFDRLEP